MQQTLTDKGRTKIQETMEFISNLEPAEATRFFDWMDGYMLAIKSRKEHANDAGEIEDAKNECTNS